MITSMLTSVKQDEGSVEAWACMATGGSEPLVFIHSNDVEVAE